MFDPLTLSHIFPIFPPSLSPSNPLPHLSIYLSTYLSTHPSVYLFIFPSVYSIHLSIHLSVYPPTPTHPPPPQVLLVQIAVPSRTDVPEYQKLRSMVHEIVGRINGQFGTLTYVPIYHLDTSLSFTELCALYAVTDVAMVTSLVGGGV